uniref:Protein SEC13 homolog n=1 Tax=Mesocestoides corti TaxID=53468 RepID=A0A5K3EUF8_MESCO
MVSVYQTVDTNHEDIIHDAQMNYYGTTLATCSSDESIKLFDVKDKKQNLVAELRGHQGPVWGLSWSHPIHGNLLASCSYDRSVIIWGEEDGKWRKVYEYTGHESSVNAVAWGPHEYGLVLACASSDGSISILTCTSSGNWEAAKIPDAHSAGVNAISWAPAINADFMLNPSISQAASNLVKRIVSGGCDFLVKIWREENGSRNWVKEVQLENGHSDWVRDVAWCPSLSLARQQIASCGQDGRVIVWQSQRRIGATTADELITGPEDWKPVVLATYPDVVWNVSWSLTGNILAVSGGDNKVSLWKENLEGVWVTLSEVSRARQTHSATFGTSTNMESNSSIGLTNQRDSRAPNILYNRAAVPPAVTPKSYHELPTTTTTAATGTP